MMLKLIDKLNKEIEIHFLEKAEQKYWKNVFMNSMDELKFFWRDQHHYLETNKL